MSIPIPSVPYIGITDFTKMEQVERMYSAFHAHLVSGQKRRLHVGVMMSYKTLNDIPTEWANSFAPKEKIADIFFCNEVMNCLHYADYHNVEIEKNLTQAIGYGGDCMHALQLDMTWPDPLAVRKALDASGKNLEIILQVGKRAIEDTSGHLPAIMERIARYEGIIHYVLLDKSMGKGLGMDAEGLIPIIETTKALFPDLGIAVAGGLGPETLHLVHPIVRDFPDVSIDAQGRLRPSGSALDPVDWDMAETYLVRALDLFSVPS